MVSDVATAAAQWWAVQVGAPVHKATTLGPDDPDREYGEFVFAAMGLLASDHPVDSAASAKFVEALAAAIDRSGLPLTLSVDYGPCSTLADAAAAAGVDNTRFPIKTRMWIRADHITAALGYASPSKLIWAEPGWQHPACDSQRYTADFEPRDEICSKLRYHDGDHGDWIADPNRCSRCGGTYVGHFGSGQALLDHSWNPVKP